MSELQIVPNHTLKLSSGIKKLNPFGHLEFSLYFYSAGKLFPEQSVV
jgi:hypothetical protein